MGYTNELRDLVKVKKGRDPIPLQRPDTNKTGRSKSSNEISTV